MDWTYNTIWKEQLPLDAYATVNCEKGKVDFNATSSTTYFNVHKFKTKRQGFQDLNCIKGAEYLEVNFSNIRSLEDVGKLGRIKRLELCWCLKLESDAGLAEIKDDLNWLHINTSKKFSPVKELFELHELKVLCLNMCGTLENLRFLEKMPRLVDFRFVDTNVLDGDLTPLMEHPSLVNAGFLDKRHYNFKSRDVAAHFKERCESEREYVHKGEFRTFRYKAFGQRN